MSQMLSPMTTAVSIGAELFGCSEEQVSVRFGLFDPIAGHDWRLLGSALTADEVGPLCRCDRS
jgi:hypothetical protein